MQRESYGNVVLEKRLDPADRPVKTRHYWPIGQLLHKSINRALSRQQRAVTTDGAVHRIRRLLAASASAGASKH